MRMFESDPTPNTPPAARNRTPSNIPSPRFDSVIGHSPATAPERASAAVSSGCIWVAWITHQRASIPTWSSSTATGGLPWVAVTSSTSAVCSAAWMWTGSPGRRLAACRASSGGTARRLCGATPVRASAPNAPTAAAAPSTSRAKASMSLQAKRVCPPSGARPSQPPCI